MSNFFRSVRFKSPPCSPFNRSPSAEECCEQTRPTLYPSIAPDAPCRSIVERRVRLRSARCHRCLVSGPRDHWYVLDLFCASLIYSTAPPHAAPNFHKPYDIIITGSIANCPCKLDVNPPAPWIPATHHVNRTRGPFPRFSRTQVSCFRNCSAKRHFCPLDTFEMDDSVAFTACTPWPRHCHVERLPKPVS